MTKLEINCETPGGTLTELRMISATNSQKKTLSSPPVSSAMPAMKIPSTKLLVTTVHCTTASGSRSAASNNGRQNDAWPGCKTRR